MGSSGVRIARTTRVFVWPACGCPPCVACAQSRQRNAEERRRQCEFIFYVRSSMFYFISKLFFWLQLFSKTADTGLWRFSGVRTCGLFCFHCQSVTRIRKRHTRHTPVASPLRVCHASLVMCVRDVPTTCLVSKGTSRYFRCIYNETHRGRGAARRVPSVNMLSASPSCAAAGPLPDAAAGPVRRVHRAGGDGARCDGRACLRGRRLVVAEADVAATAAGDRSAAGGGTPRLCSTAVAARGRGPGRSQRCGGGGGRGGRR